MGEATGSGQIVVAQLSLSKGDVYLIETVRAFPSEALAREWMKDQGHVEGAFGGWPDWTEYRVMYQEGDRYISLEGMPHGTVQE